MLPPDTSIGAVRLAVADLDGMREFYERSIGLRTIEQRDGTATLGANGSPLVELVADPDAPPRPPRTTGLFHLAILLPSRLELARALRRVAESGWRFTGASDHLVSEALYLNDPEGNGIEIYRDRPRDEWRVSQGELQMATLPLDVQGVAGELTGAEDADDGMPEDTRMGHVHLNVSDIPAAEAFYSGVLGFDVMVRTYPGALFVAAGGYHHHIGLNTWNGEGAPPPPAGSLGLRRFEVLVPSAGDLDDIAGRAAAAGIQASRDDEGLHLADPSGNRLLLRAA